MLMIKTSVNNIVVFVFILYFNFIFLRIPKVRAINQVQLCSKCLQFTMQLLRYVAKTKLFIVHCHYHSDRREEWAWSYKALILNVYPTFLVFIALNLFSGQLRRLV